MRSRQLSLFLNTFLAHPHVKVCRLVPIYFKGKAYGEGSLENIQNLISYMNGQPIPKSPNTRIGVQDAQAQWKANSENKSEMKLIVDPSKQPQDSLSQSPGLSKKGSSDPRKFQIILNLMSFVLQNSTESIWKLNSRQLART